MHFRQKSIYSHCTNYFLLYFFFSVKHIADNENAVLETHLLGVHYRKFFTPDQFFHYEMVAKTFFFVNFIADNPPKITHQSE